MYGGFNIIPRNPYTNTQRLFNENREIMSLSFVGIDYNIDTSNNLLTINYPQMGATIVTTSLGELTPKDALINAFAYDISYNPITISLTLGVGDSYDDINNTVTINNQSLADELISKLIFTGTFTLNGKTLITSIGNYSSDDNTYSSNDGKLRNDANFVLIPTTGNTLTFMDSIMAFKDDILTISNITYIILNGDEYRMSLNTGNVVTIIDATDPPISNINVDYNGYYEQTDITYTASFITLTINEDSTWFELMLSFTSSVYESIDIKIGETVLINVNPIPSIYLKIAKVNDNFIVL